MTAKDASGTWRVETGTSAPHGGVRTRLVAALVSGLVLAAGVGASFAVHRYAAARAAETAGWHGKVVRIAQSGPEAARGLTIARHGVEARATEGAELGSGTRLVTDPLTRARVRLDDGTELVLDRSTKVTMLASPRALRLEEGQVAVELPDAPRVPGPAGAAADPVAHFFTPEGEVVATGARLLLTAIPGETDLEVVRGSAVMTSATGRVDVGAGEEGRARAGAPLAVTPLPDLARRLAFTERVGASGEEPRGGEAASTGLGELVARRPGKTDEKDRALHLSTHAATIRVAANVARTEVLEEFTNDTGDDLEGVYRFPLPAGASIESLALDVDGQMVPGSFVEKAKAAAIWRGAIQNASPKAPKPKEEILWVPGPWRDPALLEWNGSGRFELKIFPIPKHGSRRIRLGYTETVPAVAGARRYVYPLPDRAVGMAPIDHFALDVQVRGAQPVRSAGYDLVRPAVAEAGLQKLAMSADSFRPTGDLTLEYTLLGDRTADVTAWAYDDGASGPKTPSGSSSDGGDPFVALAMRPKLPRWEHPAWRDQVIVVDGGHSMTGERFQKARRLATEMAQEMDRRDRVTVLLCDVTCRSLPEGWLSPGAPSASAVQAFLADVAPEGATDLVGAVRAALGSRLPANDLRIVVLSSGFGGAGYRRLDRVHGEVASALEDARAEVIAVPIGGDADQRVLGEIARAGGGVLVPYAPGQTPEEVALGVLGASYGATLRDVTLTLPDGFYGAPATLAPMRAGSEQIATFRMHGDRVQGDAILRGKVGGQPFEARYPIDVRASNEPGNAFVPRLYASERVTSLERTEGEAARPELVHLSQRFSVPCRYTSLLVLESEAMFQAFGIERAMEAPPVFTGESVANASFASAPDVEGRIDAASGMPPAPPGARRADAIGFGGGGALGAAHADNGSGKDDLEEQKRSTPAKAMHAPARIAAEAPAASATRPTLPADLAPATTAAPPPLAAARRPVGRWMRRQWFRAATITGPTPPASNEKLAAARAALVAAPDDRAKYKELARLLSQDGSLGELEDVVSRWTSRDPFDADALAARSDLLARRGRRVESLRVLSGLLGTTRSMPAKDEAALERALAKAYGRAGRPEACAFWVGAAELAPSEVDSVARAAACERTQGRDEAAGRWLASLPGDATRAKATPLVEQYATAARNREASSDRATWGDLVVDASWDEGTDLDVVIIDPSGSRQSWSSRSGSVRVSDPRSSRHEAVALTSYAAGPFMIEVVRGEGADDAAPIHGRVRIRALGGEGTSDEGATQSRDFVLAGERAEVARVDVRWDSRLVPTSAPVL
jgi:hypothetical protein